MNIKKVRRKGELEVCAIKYRVEKEGLMEKMISEQKHEDVRE